MFDIVGSQLSFLQSLGFRHGFHGARLDAILSPNRGVADIVGPKIANTDLSGCQCCKNRVNINVPWHGNWRPLGPGVSSGVSGVSGRVVGQCTSRRPSGRSGRALPGPVSRQLAAFSIPGGFAEVDSELALGEPQADAQGEHRDPHLDATRHP